MKTVQKAIVISTFILEAMIFNSLFCNWKVGSEHRVSVEQWQGRLPDLSGMIMSFGPLGIYARKHLTFAPDVLLGIAVPILFLAAALFTCTLDSNATKRPAENELPTQKT